MGSSHRIERERLEKRARVLDAARALFVERGIEAVTLREIAQRIEYSTTAIYVHFRDKAALVEAMVIEDFAAFAEGLEATAKIADPVARIHALHLAYIDFALAMPRHYQLLFLTPQTGEKSGPEAATPAGIDGYRVLLTAVEDCIRTQRFRPELTDANAVAQTVWAAVHGMVSLQIVVGRHDQFRWASRDSLTRMSYEIVMRGMLRDPDELAKPRRAKPRAR